MYDEFVKAAVSCPKNQQSLNVFIYYVNNRKANDPEFKQNHEEGYQSFKTGALLRQAREASGLTQEEIAEKLHTKKSAISRIENHAEDIKLSTLEKIASVLGKKIEVLITPNS